MILIAAIVAVGIAAWALCLALRDHRSGIPVTDRRALLETRAEHAARLAYEQGAEWPRVVEVQGLTERRAARVARVTDLAPYRDAA